MITMPSDLKRIQNTQFLFSKECPWAGRRFCMAVYNCVTVTCKGYCGRGEAISKAGLEPCLWCRYDPYDGKEGFTTEWRDR
jgi:hypothetical protein